MSKNFIVFNFPDTEFDSKLLVHRSFLQKGGTENHVIGTDQIDFCYDEFGLPIVFIDPLDTKIVSVRLCCPKCRDLLLTGLKLL